MRAHYTNEDGPNLSEELKAKFKKALKGKLELPRCRDCVKPQKCRHVINFLIPLFSDAITRMDRASVRMELFIDIVEQLEVKAMKERFEEPERI